MRAAAEEEGTAARAEAKHLRHASFLGMRDSVQGSSANVLTGGTASFGSTGFKLRMDLRGIMQSH